MANLPLGLATIGSGQVMRLLGRKMTENSDRETLLTSGIEAVQELEKRIKQQVNEQFAELTQQLKDAIADLYDQGISKIRQSLEEAIDTHQKLVTKKEKIGRLDLETIPELRQLFYQIFNPH
jgi:GH24 family phage-related lysozyme (muramidase)